MGIQFKRATKTGQKARIALFGPSGSGKTYTSLTLASHMGKRVAVIDSERGSASKYAGEFEFDVIELDSYEPQLYIEAIAAAEEAGYDVCVIDSLSHAWMGKGGALEQVDAAAKRQRTQNSFTAWRDITPIHNQLIDTIIASKMHVIATMRSKTAYVQEQNERGKTSIHKVGLEPIQRDGMEYEFDIVGTMTEDNELIVTKTRCSKLAGAVVRKPGESFAKVVTAWLSDAVPMPERKPVPMRESSPQQKQEPQNAEPTLEDRIAEAHTAAEVRALWPLINKEAPKGDPRREALVALAKARVDELEPPSDVNGNAA